MDLVNIIGNFKKRIQIRIRLIKEDIYRKYVRRNLANRDFTIISNNCWGGGIYETLGLKYNTPTVGLFFYAPCYIKFIEDLKKHAHSDIIFIRESKYIEANNFRKDNNYPLGLINGEIEIHFLHYISEKEAREKWDRRKKRINYSNLYFSFTDNDLCTINEVRHFDMVAEKGVFFSAKYFPQIKSLVWLKKFEKMGKVGDLYSNPWLYRKHFDYIKWLNK